MKVAVILESFPTVSETFIVNHITGLIDNNINVAIYSRTLSDNTIIHDDITKYNLLNRLRYEPITPNNYIFRFFKVFWLLLKKPLSVFIYLRHFKLLITTYKRDFINLRIFYTIYPYLDDKNYDFVHCHFATMANSALVIRDFGLLNGKLVTTFHGFDLTRKDIVQKKDFIYNKLSKECSIYTANSNFTKNLACTFGINPENIHVIPVSLDISKFIRTGNYPTDVFKIITVGRLSEMKGIEYSIRAVKKVLDNSEKNIEYNIIGNGELKNHLQNLIENLNIADKVHLLGAKTQEDIIEYMNNSNLFLLTGVQAATGHVETQGLVIQEAQAMKLPVIVANVGGVSEGLINGETGFLVEVKNIDDIASKLLYLINTPSEIIRMGTNGRSFVELNYDKAIISKKMISLYTN